MRGLILKSLFLPLTILLTFSGHSQNITQQEYDSLNYLLNTVTLDDTTKLNYYHEMRWWEMQVNLSEMSPSLLKAEKLAKKIKSDKELIRVYFAMSYQIPDSLFLEFSEKIENFIPKIPTLDSTSVEKIINFYILFRSKGFYLKGLEYLQTLEPYFTEDEKDCDNLILILIGRGELMASIKNQYSQRFYYKKAIEKAKECNSRDLEHFSELLYAGSYIFERNQEEIIKHIKEIFLDSTDMHIEYRTALYGALANAYYQIGNYAAAEPLTQELIEINYRYSALSGHTTAGRIATELKLFEKAKKHFQTIKKDFPNLFYKGSFSKASLGIDEAHLFIALEQYDSAEIILNASLNTFNSLSELSDQSFMIEDCMNELINLYKKTGNYPQVIKYQQLIIDEAVTKEKADAAAQAVQFEANRIEQNQKSEIFNLSSANEKQRYLLFTTLGFILMLLLLGGTILRQRQRLSKEKQKSEALLLNVLPPSIATRMKSGENPIADYFDEATVVFIDMANFTSMSSQTSPQQILHLLNEVFTKIDALTEEFGMEKIKTIGDCYMAVAGIPVTKENHLEKAILFSQKVLTTFEDMEYFGHKIEFKIGIETGPAIAGVIGEKRFLYDLWGDTVNTASRMESFGKPGIVQTTKNVQEKAHHLFPFKSIGVVMIKGKGEMELFQIE